MTKRGFMDGYKRYDPEREGCGSTAQWRSAFRSRMSREEAQALLDAQKRTPYDILGLASGATWGEIRAAYRRLALHLHPDRAALNGLTVGAATGALQELHAAYTVLHDEFN
jgi:DnaJ-class molecular chaperone